MKKNEIYHFDRLDSNMKFNQETSERDVSKEVFQSNSCQMTVVKINQMFQSNSELLSDDRYEKQSNIIQIKEQSWK